MLLRTLRVFLDFVIDFTFMAQQDMFAISPKYYKYQFPVSGNAALIGIHYFHV